MGTLGIHLESASWSFFVEMVNVLRPLAIFAEKLHCGCLTGFSGFGIWSVQLHAHASAHAWNRDLQKKSCLVWFKQLQGVWQIARLKQQRFLSSPFYKMQRSYRKSCVFVISMAHWWKLYSIYIFFTQRTKDFNKLKREMNDRTIVFLTSLLVVLTWKILILFSFWYKIISCFK